MTAQTDLSIVWADTGGAIDPGAVKTALGWIVEIPTYQNFNWVLQAHSKNILALAEKGQFDWQNDINYVAGGTVNQAGIVYSCKVGNINQDPATDTTGAYWLKGRNIGADAFANTLIEHGVRIKDVQPQTSATVWDGNAVTLANKSSLVQLETSAATRNWLFGNVVGELVCVDIGTTTIADGRSIALADSAVHKIYHEGNKPTQSEVSGTIPDASADGIIYGRKNNVWIKVSTNVVSTEPPPPVLGDGSGWFNLSDAQQYVDIDDGDSSQWVPSNPPLIPSAIATKQKYESPATSLVSGTNTTFTHGLAEAPSIVTVEMVCNTIDLGYAVGDVVHTHAWGVGVSQPDALTLRAIVPTGSILMLNKTTGVEAGVTLASWDYVVKAWI